MREFGLPGLFVDVMLEALGLPLPGETLIIVASGLAAVGQMNIFAVAATAFAAAVVGDNIGYLIGRKLGRPLIVRHGSRFGITHERLAAAEDLIQKRGPIVVAFARFFVLLRQLNGIAAGTAGMHWLRFLAANMVGAALWVGLWSSLAYHFGKDASILPRLWHQLSTIAMFAVPAIIIALAVAALFVWRRKGGSA
ncbi:DedA family protein [Nitratireductor sp. XY-223]|uniref:DedA family protein n=1 Tax=Nitratireductor sp. XY-223 TaxID=2561926 RepID=UPI0010AB27AD|nr:DedA family protein [Nitratireductor sp. XY-223]